MANPQRFLGSSLVAWYGLSLPISQPWHLGLMFRTRQPSGVLLQAVTRGRSTITLQVWRGGATRGAWPSVSGRCRVWVWSPVSGRGYVGESFQDCMWLRAGLHVRWAWPPAGRGYVGVV